MVKRLGIHSTLVGGGVVALAKGCIKLLKKIALIVLKGIYIIIIFLILFKVGWREYFKISFLIWFPA